MKRTAFAALLSLALTACGGGSSPPVDNTKLSQAVVNSAQAVAATLPETKPYTGSFAAVGGTSVGFMEGTSERALAEQLAGLIAKSPDKYPDWYRAMISDAGLKITLFGASTGKSTITGTLLYAPDMNYIAKLTTNGVVVTQI